MTEATVGIDIGTSSVKAVAADGDGRVLASARVPHRYTLPAPHRLEHDAVAAWRDGPRRALDELERDGFRVRDARGVSVAAMVPSLTAVDRAGVPLLPGLLYGDERGELDGAPELAGFARWAADAAPEAAGLWPAQTVANFALAGAAVLDSTTAVMAHPLFDFTGWDPAIARRVGVPVEKLPEVVPTAWAAGRLPDGGPVLASGSIDALAEQIVAGADEVGDVLVLVGSTLIVWAVVDEEVAAQGCLTVPHTTPGRYLVGGPSHAGGLFVDWALGLLGGANGSDSGEPADPGRVPVWVPSPRVEHAPVSEPLVRAAFAELDIAHDATALRRAVREASGFAVRRVVEAARSTGRCDPRRVVACGGGSASDEWMQALADVTGLPVACTEVPAGAALGSAWLARLAAGLEAPTAMADGRRWARVGRELEPRPAWRAATEERYQRYAAMWPVTGAGG